MNYTIFTPQTLTDTFHVIVDTVSCIMHYGFDILSDVYEIEFALPIKMCKSKRGLYISTNIFIDHRVFF